MKKAKRILIGLKTLDHAVELTDFACRLGARGASLLLVHIIELPDPTPLDAEVPDLEAMAKKILRAAERVASRSEMKVSGLVLRAHDAGPALLDEMKEKKVDLELARELGLILPRKREGWYDVFRGRIMFPICDVHRRTVGFGGRILREGQPKYLNSPESIVYHKGEVLYGLYEAKQSISEKESVLLVEGDFDLLNLHQ